MSFNLLIKTTPSKKIDEFKPVSPTLLVGLGGTGKEVLLRFRRLIVERYGSLEALPFVQFVHLDTDRTRAAQEQYDIKAEDDPLFVKIRFQSAERVNLTIAGGTDKYVEHLKNHPNIRRWYEARGKIANLGDLGEGAGQVRMASRLGFFHAPNFGDLSARLDRAQGQLRDAANLQKASELGFQLDPSRIEIAVVASLAGGTGGGIFLDMGFLLRNVFPDADRVGVFLMPNFFRGYAGAGRARANGYAALTELNYYSFGHTFQGDWDRDNPVQLGPPPYSNTYLLDATNDAGLEIGSSGKEFDIYGIVAEFLFQDFSIGSFSGMKRATRINLEQYNLNVYTHNFLDIELEARDSDAEKNLIGDTYPTRFGSFGLAAIAFPTDRVHNACACRLARKILDSWEMTSQEDPRERLFTDVLFDPEISFVQGRYERRAGAGIIDETQIEDAMLWYDHESGKSFPDHIWDRAHSIRSEVEGAPRGQKSQVLSQHRYQVDQLLAKEDSPKPEEWGQWVRILEENMRGYLQNLEDGIRKKAEKTANDPHLGVTVSLSLLRELKSLLRNESFLYLKHFEGEIETWQEEMTRYSSELDRLQRDVEAHDQQRLFRKSDLERDMMLLVAEDKHEEELGVIYNYLSSRVMKQVAKRGKHICEEIDKFLGKDDPTGKGLIAEYYQLLGGFQQLGDGFKVKEDYFSRERSSELTISLYRSGDVDTWYKTWAGEPAKEREILKRVGNEMLSSIFGVTSVVHALEHIQETKTEEIEEQVFENCKRFFASQEEQPQALKMLLDGSRFSRAETEEKIRLAFKLGKVWLTRAKRGLDHTTLSTIKSDQRPCLIGVDTNDKAKFTQLQELIGKVLAVGDSPVAYHNIGDVNRGMIVFYNELAGVPAFYGNSVAGPHGMKEAYRSYKEKGELHIDRNRFQFGELIPKTTEEVRKYTESLRAFVLGRLLGLLKVQELGGDGSEERRFRFSYRKPDSLQVEDVLLGDELSTVDILYRDSRQPEAQTDRRQLLVQVEEVIKTLKARNKLPVYALLIDFYKRMVYPPSTDTEWVKELTIHQYSPEYAILEEANNTLQKSLIGGNREREQFRVAFESLREKRVGELTHGEYLKALKPYCKSVGKFGVRSVAATTGLRQIEYQDALVLDLAKLDYQRFEDYEEVKAAPPWPEPEPEPKTEVRERLCPNCRGMIDTRALFCKHCKKTVAQHVTCPHCGEERIPNDLENCWKCGFAMPRPEGEKKIECPNCFSFTGSESEFPCPVCNYDLTTGPPEPETETAAPETAAEVGPIPMAEPAGVKEEAPAESVNLVECPNCFEKVEAGPICPVCGTQLED